MNILGVDATGSVLTVALDADGALFAARRSGKKPHDETLLPAVEKLLKTAKMSWKDLDAVAAAAGPGRFTGIRIGLSFAAMLGMRLRIRALALSRLEAAAERSDADEILAALPGWKGEVYHQRFRRRRARLLSAGPAVWAMVETWPRLRQMALARGCAVVLADTDARDLLAVARRKLSCGAVPPFEPLYLKSAGYERPRR